jgi:tetratricopeptide (TPR) repeat protein
MTQADVAAGRYTNAYISALENGLVRPSLAAMTHVAERLGVGVDELMREQASAWERLEADLRLASGEWVDALDRYTTLLDRNPPPHEAALLHRGRAEALCRLDRPREAVGDAAKAYEILAAGEATVDAASAGYWLAFANYLLGNTAEARAIAHQLLAEVRAGLQVQDDFKLRLLIALGMIEDLDGHHDRALGFLEEARSLTDGMDTQRRARFLFSLARSYAATGDHEAAVRNGTQALGLFQALGSEVEAGSLQNILAYAHLHAGNVGRAAELAEQARNVVERLNDRRQLAHVAETQAQIALATNDRTSAHAFIFEALDLARSTGDRHAEAAAMLTLARARRADDPASAESTYAQTAELLRRVGPRRHLQEVLREWAELLVAQKRHEEAVALLQEALGEPSAGAAPRQASAAERTLQTQRA